MPATTAPPVTDLALFAELGNLSGLIRQLYRIGGCTTPIRLDGHRTEINSAVGQMILTELPAADLPAGNLLVRCNNRRATRCPACAETYRRETYRRDTYQLITAGLRGGMGIPDRVATHPRVFTNLHRVELRPSPQPPRVRPLPLRHPPP